MDASSSPPMNPMIPSRAVVARRPEAAALEQCKSDGKMKIQRKLALD